jgi:hypothetical protein
MSEQRIRAKANRKRPVLKHVVNDLLESGGEIEITIRGDKPITAPDLIQLVPPSAVSVNLAGWSLGSPPSALNRRSHPLQAVSAASRCSPRRVGLSLCRARLPYAPRSQVGSRCSRAPHRYDLRQDRHSLAVWLSTVLAIFALGDTLPVLCRPHRRLIYRNTSSSPRVRKLIHACTVVIPCDTKLVGVPAVSPCGHSNQSSLALCQ